MLFFTEPQLKNKFLIHTLSPLSLHPANTRDWKVSGFTLAVLEKDIFEERVVQTINEQLDNVVTY